MFTLSAEKAREKLAEFSLPEPRFYVLNLVASAITSGATWIKVTATSNRLSFEFDGQSLTERELESILDQLLNPKETRLFELAVALNAIRALEAKSVTVESWCVQLRLEGSNYITTPNYTGTPVNRITVVEGLQLARATKNLFTPLPEVMVLRTLASYAPSELTLNKSSVSQSVTLGAQSPTCLAWHHIAPQSPRLRFTEPSPDWSPECLISRAWKNARGDYEAILALDWSTASGPPPDVLIVNNGISFHRPAKLFDTPFAQVVVSAALNKNLSHTDLAEDDAYRTLVQNIQRDLDDLFLKRLECELPLPSSQTEHLVNWSDKLAARFQAHGDEASASRVTLWRKEAQFGLDILNEDLWASLREELTQRTNRKEDEALVTRVRLALAEAGLSALESSLFNDCHTCFERLREIHNLQQRKAPELDAMLSIAHELSGETIPTFHLPEKICSELLLIQGHFLEAATLPSPSSQALLATKEFELAETSLRKSLSQESTPERLEALSDCLAFSELSDKTRRREALELREKARDIQESLDIAWGNFLLNDLVSLAKSALPWTSWLSYRMKAVTSGQIPSDLAQHVEANLDKATKALIRGPAAIVRVKSVVLKAEKQLPVDHPFLDAVRGRAAHCLRRAQYWGEAEQILARGRLLKRLSAYLKACSSQEG